MSERIDIEPVPTIGWRDDAVVLLDQRRLPHAEVAMRVESVDELVEAIQTLAIRGAPALGIAGAFGVALIARTGAAEDVVRREAERVAGARPTAVNLRHGVERALSALPGGAGAVRAVAERMLEEETRANRAASERAAGFLLAACPGGRLRVLTHCNTGRLATGGWVRRSARSGPWQSGTRSRRSSPPRPGRCCRAPGSPRGSCASSAYRIGCVSTPPPRR